MKTKHKMRTATFLFSFAASMAVHGGQDGATSGEKERAGFTVDAALAGKTILPQLFGHNLEHTRKAIWRGIIFVTVINEDTASACEVVLSLVNLKRLHEA